VWQGLRRMEPYGFLSYLALLHWQASIVLVSEQHWHIGAG
jgi:hypothetical protein